MSKQGKGAQGANAPRMLNWQRQARKPPPPPPEKKKLAVDAKSKKTP